jgi:hypothetical protein
MAGEKTSEAGRTGANINRRVENRKNRRSIKFVSNAPADARLAMYQRRLPIVNMICYMRHNV